VKSLFAAFLCSLLFAGPAFAQGDVDDSVGSTDAPDTTDTADTTTASDTDTPVVADEEPLPKPPTEPADTNMEPDRKAADGGVVIPNGMGIGIGAGYIFPADIDRINTASVRARLGNITIEPRVQLSTDRQSIDAGGAEIENTGADIVVETTARIPLASTGDLELVIIGGIGFGFSSTNPEGSDNDTKTTTFGVLWGVGIDYWLTGRWAVSLSGTNTLFGVTSSSVDQPGGSSNDQTDMFVGAVFNPTIGVLTHLYFF